MARLGATHRTTAPSCTPATRDRAGRLHRDVHGRPAACRNLGLLDDSGVASASRPRVVRGPQAPGRQPGHPGARSSSPAASGRPGWAPVHPLRRDPRSAPPPGGRPRAAGTTDGDASAPRQSRKTLSAAPIRAPGVKRAYGSSPVTTRAAGLGQLFFWILPRSCPGSSRRAARGQSWSARSRAAARTNELDAGKRRKIVKGGEGAGCDWIVRVACWFPALAGGVVSQAPIRRRARARLP
jgi:hypothetical protein